MIRLSRRVRPSRGLGSATDLASSERTCLSYGVSQRQLPTSPSACGRTGVSSVPWAGDRPADVIPWPDEDEGTYPLPFHPLDLGEDILRPLCGFAEEGRPEPDDVDTDTIQRHGFRVQDPHAPDPAEQDTQQRKAMRPPHVYTLGPDGSLIKRDGL
ncbi:DUF6928 family protein [Streptomyces pilosus]|uniref:DUF6928 family protein n=1 Tax=Streptomyces pilosus TaxID=28893 RepID=UPI003627303E